MIPHRRLAGRWRRSAWPLAVICAPAEKKEGYNLLLDTVAKEFEARKLPQPKRWLTDWFPGIESNIKANFPEASWHGGVEHMRRALCRNQKAGEREQDGKKPPHLVKRSIYPILAYISATQSLPTRAQFHVFWSVMLDRIISKWEASACVFLFRSQMKVQIQ